jgi:hypothetical protein
MSLRIDSLETPALQYEKLKLDTALDSDNNALESILIMTNA